MIRSTEQSHPNPEEGRMERNELLVRGGGESQEPKGVSLDRRGIICEKSTSLEVNDVIKNLGKDGLFQRGEREGKEGGENDQGTGPGNRFCDMTFG